MNPGGRFYHKKPRDRLFYDESAHLILVEIYEMLHFIIAHVNGNNFFFEESPELTNLLTNVAIAN